MSLTTFLLFNKMFNTTFARPWPAHTDEFRKVYINNSYLVALISV